MINLPIGQVLLSSGLITEEQLQIALEEQRLSKNERLADIILKFGFITETQYLSALATRLNVKFIREPIAKVDEKLLNIVPYDVAVKYTIMPLALDGNVLTIMTFDPLDFYKMDDVRILLGLEIKTVLALNSTIIASIDKCYKQTDRKLSSKNDVMAVAGDLFDFLESRGYRNVSVTKDKQQIHITIKL